MKKNEDNLRVICVTCLSFPVYRYHSFIGTLRLLNEAATRGCLSPYNFHCVSLTPDIGYQASGITLDYLTHGKYF